MLRRLLALVLCLAALPAWADDTPTFFADPASHCSVGTFYPLPALAVRWTGGCAGGKAEGAGVAEWQNAGKFWVRIEGTFHTGLVEGRGLKLQAGDIRFEAEFQAGRVSGRCIMTTPDVRVDGQCANDQLNGPGTATFTNGNRYEGNFKDSSFNGQGIFSEKNGSRIEGEWLDNHLNGKGRGVYPGIGRYEGDFVNGDFEGTGTYYFDDGNVYEGEWTHNLPNGRGVYHNTTHGLMGTFHRDFAGTWVNGCFAQDILQAHLFKTAAQCGFSDE